ncbi:hypothetical protein M9Y10_010843 [Tritrichomonas musculus]|uniref:NADAR domain-containing protein n=1 Tax=Tritrichomonas musculus TaxID=1915356 RepID=A0ABR2ILT2_9EUKA
MSQQTTQDIYSLEKLQQVWREGQRFPFIFFWQSTKEDVQRDQYNQTCCNQWFPSEFTDESGKKYNCCEQYMMAHKAILFNDNETLDKILRCNDPRRIKRLGREIKPFDPVKWNQNDQEIVFRGNMYKFTQIEKCKNFILSVPRNAIFVEASPLDKKWGIKLAADDPRASNPLEWKGTNYLGFQITRVRDYLISHPDQ